MSLRHTPNEELAGVYHGFSETLRRAVDLGVTFFDDWCPSRPFGGEEWGLAPLAVYRSILEKLDGAVVLIESSCVDSLAIVLRTAWEGLIQLAYMIQDRTRERSLAYLYYAIQEYDKGCEELGLEPSAEPLSHAFDPVFAELRGLKKRDKANWYCLFPSTSTPRPHNVKELAERLDMMEWYNHFYGPVSGLVHNAHPRQYFKADPNGITRFIPLRDPGMLQQLTVIGVRICKWSTRLVVAKYSSHNLAKFDSRFAQNVQPGLSVLEGLPVSNR